MLFRIVVLLIALFCSTLSAEQTVPLDIKLCEVHTPYGIPTSKKIDTSTICRKGYVTQHDNQAKIPIWVSYSLTPAHAVGCLKRSNSFAADKSLPASKRSDPDDYSRSGYDTGHIANAADMSWDEDVEHDSFILTNMTPQLPALNRGQWKELETNIRSWTISNNHTLLIYAGPIYNTSTNKKIGKGVVVPDAFFKIVIDQQTFKTISFIFPHEDVEHLENQRVSIATIEKQTAVVFPVPQKVSKKTVSDMWPVDQKLLVSSKKVACSVAQ